MEKKKIIILSLSVSILISGMLILFSFTETPKPLGLFLVISSGIVIYLIIRNKINNAINKNNKAINKHNLILGLSLVLFDLSYNLYRNDALRYFDYGMISSGLFIVFLNIRKFNFFMKDKFMINFTSYFLFTILMLYGFIFTGITFLLGVPTEQNPILIYMTQNALNSSAFFANFLEPTSISGITLNFDGFLVSVWYPCSGVESISVFISAIIAFFIATKETNWKKIVIFSFVGIISLYLMNILRILILLIVGRNYGIEVMLFVHYNLGWIMFVFGMMVFWMLAFKNIELKE